MRKEPRSMLIHSEALAKSKIVGRRNYMCHMRQIPLTRIESGRLSHQDGITQPTIKTLSLAIVIPIMDLVIKK
jgi:hypothetical protein